jgi:peroxiredoxin Q/BCP
LRQDAVKFEKRGAVIIALGPDGPNAFRTYWAANNFPFIGLPDLRSRVAATYEQEINLFKFGRMPALFVIDREGVIRYAHYGDSMSDIPTNETVLGIVDEINAEGG